MVLLEVGGIGGVVVLYFLNLVVLRNCGYCLFNSRGKGFI